MSCRLLSRPHKTLDSSFHLSHVRICHKSCYGGELNWILNIIVSLKHVFIFDWIKTPNSRQKYVKWHLKHLSTKCLFLKCSTLLLTKREHRMIENVSLVGLVSFTNCVIVFHLVCKTVGSCWVRLSINDWFKNQFSYVIIYIGGLLMLIFLLPHGGHPDFIEIP